SVRRHDGIRGFPSRVAAVLRSWCGRQRGQERRYADAPAATRHIRAAGRATTRIPTRGMNCGELWRTSHFMLQEGTGPRGRENSRVPLRPGRRLKLRLDPGLVTRLR